MKIIIIAALLLGAASASAQDAALEHCQYLKNQMDLYKDLRREGGSTEQRNDWKKSKKEYQDEYDKQRCRKYRRKLK